MKWSGLDGIQPFPFENISDEKKRQEVQRARNACVIVDIDRVPEHDGHRETDDERVFEHQQVRQKHFPQHHAEQEPQDPVGVKVREIEPIQALHVIVEQGIERLEYEIRYDQSRQQADVLFGGLNTLGEITGRKNKQRHMKRVNELIDRSYRCFAVKRLDEMPHDHQQDQYEFEVIEIGVSLFHQVTSSFGFLVHRSFVLVYRRDLGHFHG